MSKRRAEDFVERVNEISNLSPFEILLRSFRSEFGASGVQSADVQVKLYRVSITPKGFDDEIHLEFEHGGLTIEIDCGPVNGSEDTFEITTNNGRYYQCSKRSSPCRIIVPPGRKPVEVLADIHHHITTIFRTRETSELKVNCTDTPAYFGTFFIENYPVRFDVLKVRQAGLPASFEKMMNAIRVRRVLDFALYKKLPPLMNPLELIVIRDGRIFDWTQFSTLLARQIRIYNVNSVITNLFLVEWRKDKSEASELIRKMEMTIGRNLSMDRIMNGFEKEANGDLEENGVLRELNANEEVSRFEDVRNGHHMIHEHTGRLATIYQRGFTEICLHVWDQSPLVDFKSNIRGFLGEASSLADKKKSEKEAIERMLKRKERELEELQIAVNELKREVDTCQTQITQCHEFREANRLHYPVEQ